MSPSIWSKDFLSVAEELVADRNLNWRRVITADALSSEGLKCGDFDDGPERGEHEKDLLADSLAS